MSNSYLTDELAREHVRTLLEDANGARRANSARRLRRDLRSLRRYRSEPRGLAGAVRHPVHRVHDWLVSGEL